jgi:hypothetical protein
MPATQGRSDEMDELIEAVVTQAVRRGAKRFGYLLAAVINVVLLWISHQLLDWGWPGFLTPEFDDLLPIVTVSFVVTIIANLVYVVADGWPIKPVGELASAVIGFVVALRSWQIFPFEFSGDDWSWLVRLILVVAMVGTTIGAIVQLANLAKGAPTADRQAG